MIQPKRTRRCAVDWPAPLWNAGPPPACQSVGLGPSVPLPTPGARGDVYSNPLRAPLAGDFVVHHYHRQLRHASASACGRAHVRLYVSCMCMRMHACVRACVRLDDATSRPLTAISAAGHQRVPTGPNRPGQPAS